MSDLFFIFTAPTSKPPTPRCDVLKTVDDMETGDVEAPIAKKSHPLHDVMQSILDVNSDNVICEQSSPNQGFFKGGLILYWHLKTSVTFG